jgi:hypothetical protein
MNMGEHMARTRGNASDKESQLPNNHFVRGNRRHDSTLGTGHPLVAVALALATTLVISQFHAKRVRPEHFKKKGTASTRKACHQSHSAFL